MAEEEEKRRALVAIIKDISDYMKYIHAHREALYELYVRIVSDLIDMLTAEHLNTADLQYAENIRLKIKQIADAIAELKNYYPDYEMDW